MHQPRTSINGSRGLKIQIRHPHRKRFLLRWWKG